VRRCCREPNQQAVSALRPSSILPLKGPPKNAFRVSAGAGQSFARDKAAVTAKQAEIAVVTKAIGNRRAEITKLVAKCRFIAALKFRLSQHDRRARPARRDAPKCAAYDAPKRAAFRIGADSTDAIANAATRSPFCWRHGTGLGERNRRDTS
jgi:hypothetical protein